MIRLGMSPMICCNIADPIYSLINFVHYRYLCDLEAPDVSNITLPEEASSSKKGRKALPKTCKASGTKKVDALMSKVATHIGSSTCGKSIADLGTDDS